MERTTSPDILDRFAEIIERDGIERGPRPACSTSCSLPAAPSDASAMAMAVVVDPTEPAVARERAFGLLSIQIIGRADRASSAVQPPASRGRHRVRPARSVDRRNQRPAPLGAA